MKRIILILVCLIFCTSAGAESLKDAKYLSKDTGKKVFNEKNFPLTCKYFKDYAADIFYKFNPKPHFGTEVFEREFMLHNDGTISFLWALNKNDLKKEEKFFINNAPPAFPQGMEDKLISTTVTILTGRKKNIPNQVSVNYIGNRGGCENIEIMIYKNNKYKNTTKRKCAHKKYKWNTQKSYCEIPFEFVKEIDTMSILYN